MKKLLFLCLMTSAHICCSESEILWHLQKLPSQVKVWGGSNKVGPQLVDDNSQLDSRSFFKEVTFFLDEQTFKNSDVTGAQFINCIVELEDKTTRPLTQEDVKTMGAEGTPQIIETKEKN